MNLRTVGSSLLTFALSTLLFATIAHAQDDRAADRAAIKAHIESIFQAFIKKDIAALRATHAGNWLGYLEGSRTMIKGIDGYMDWNQVDAKSPYGMKSYKFREFDMIFKGDAAFVCFVADVESNWPGAPPHRPGMGSSVGYPRVVPVQFSRSFARKGRIDRGPPPG